jgi:hypothetical protein
MRTAGAPPSASAVAPPALSDCPVILGAQNFFSRDKNHDCAGGEPLVVSHKCGCRGKEESQQSRYRHIIVVGLGACRICFMWMRLPSKDMSVL